jgi:citrate lyase subunit beta/citryl-CoA lyase
MRSPGQFEHALIARAKAELVAAALAAGVVPAHNVTLDIKNPYQTWADARRARAELQHHCAHGHCSPIHDARRGCGG